MTHPKNSNKPTVVQEALLTDGTPFHELSHREYESSLLEVRCGKPAKEALNLSSMLMGSALEIMASLTDEGMTTNHIYGVRFLIEASAALVDASVGPVEYGNRQGGAQ
ncbi:hypothetical protein A7J50_1175 [Pseudomonas antarctica]|uniref:DUF3077 domain-containing protein n=1 Tax=Pseudomonas antarctica TaxID=219572 RepID=A0A172YWU7_9PSED|nr:DUF3077 domain-containing protein [Pseudomonas antarctica]ANF84614.1 hypothetical protein A7J50_1175 [Pseudomonas antarctica]